MTLTVSSDEAGATFSCQLDKKPAAPCASGKTFKRLKPKRHTVTVTAADAAGNADPTPAVVRFRVKRPRPPVTPG